ncbi:MAG: hypothetical protein ACK4ON_13030, partial [Bacteroidia bacterium]
MPKIIKFVAQNYKDLTKRQMVAGFFRNNDRFGYVLLPVAALSVWLFSMLLPQFHVLSDFHSSFFFYDVFPLSGKFGYWALNLLVNIINTYLLTHMCVKHEISEKYNFLPAFFYLILSGIINLSGSFHSVLPAMTFLILA